MTSAQKFDYRQHLDFLTKEQSELRKILSSDSTIVRFLHLQEFREYSPRLKRTIRVLKMILEIVDPYFGYKNYYGTKIHLKMPHDRDSDRVLKVIRSEDLEDVLCVLDLDKDRLTLPENYKLEDLREDWLARLFKCEDHTEMGIGNNPAKSMLNLYAFEPKTGKLTKKINQMKKGLDRVYSNYNSARQEMKRLSGQDEPEKMHQEEAPEHVETPSEGFTESHDEHEMETEKSQHDAPKKELYEHGISAEQTGLDSKIINLPNPNIEERFNRKFQMQNNVHYDKFTSNKYLNTMQRERRNYASQDDYTKDLTISNHRGKYNFQKGFYKGSKYESSRRENHYDLKMRTPQIYEQIIKASNYCNISKITIDKFIVSPESIAQNLSPLLTSCKKRSKYNFRASGWGLTDLQILLYKLSQLPKDKIKFKAFVSTDPKDMPIIPNFDNSNPKPNKYGVVGQYQFKGVVQNAGYQYQSLKGSLLNKGYTPLRVNYSKIK